MQIEIDEPALQAALRRAAAGWDNALCLCGHRWHAAGINRVDLTCPICSRVTNQPLYDRRMSL